MTFYYWIASITVNFFIQSHSFTYNYVKFFVKIFVKVALSIGFGYTYTGCTRPLTWKVDRKHLLDVGLLSMWGACTHFEYKWFFLIDFLLIGMSWYIQSALPWLEVSKINPFNYDINKGQKGLFNFSSMPWWNMLCGWWNTQNYVLKVVFLFWLVGLNSFQLFIPL